MKRMLQKTMQSVLAGSILFMAGCYPREDLTVSELDLVVTIPDQSVDFSLFQTFSLPDSVIRIGDEDNEEGPFDQLMLNLVRSNLESLGYVEETNPLVNPADVVVFVELLIVDNYVISGGYPIWDYWGWWGGWYPGWGYGPGWGGGYPYVPVVSSYTTGTIIIDMIDPNNPNMSEEEIPIVWSAFLNGLVQGSASTTETRITNTINQAFDQSPYLATN